MLFLYPAYIVWLKKKKVVQAAVVFNSKHVKADKEGEKKDLLRIQSVCTSFISRLSPCCVTRSDCPVPASPPAVTDCPSQRPQEFLTLREDA